MMSRFALLSVAVALLFPMSAEAIKLHLSPNVAAEACDYLADGDNKQAAACYQRVRSDPVISAQLVEWHRFQKHLRLYGPGCKFIQDEMFCWPGKKSLSPEGVRDIIQDAWR